MTLMATEADDRFEVVGPTQIVAGHPFAVYDFTHHRVAHASAPDYQSAGHGEETCCCLLPGPLAYFTTQAEARQWIQKRGRDRSGREPGGLQESA